MECLNGITLKKSFIIKFEICVGDNRKPFKISNFPKESNQSSPILYLNLALYILLDTSNHLESFIKEYYLILPRLLHSNE